MKFKSNLLLSALLLIFVCPTIYAAYSWPNGFYVNGGLTYGYVHSRLDADVTPLSPNDRLTGRTIDDWEVGGIVAAGYAIKQMPLRMDLAYIIINKADYDSKPIFKNVPVSGNLTGDLRLQGLFINGYYDMSLFGRFKAYIGAGVGQARNKTSTNVTIAGIPFSKSYSKTGLAWQATVGLRVKVARNVYFDIAGKHIDFGKAKWGPFPWYAAPPVTNTITTNRVAADEAAVSITVFFGDQTPYQPPTLINDMDEI